uniref:Plasmodium vivax Vir protein n=1 Tax=Meloidogyne hapla TaxID=6305 RepID=A0A1I8BNV1_MELHA
MESFEGPSGVKYSDLPTYAYRRMLNEKTGKDKVKGTKKGVEKGQKHLKDNLQSRYNVKVKNKYSALDGLTEEKERKLFENEKIKSIENIKGKEKCDPECVDECVEDPPKIRSRKARKLMDEGVNHLTVTADNNPFDCNCHCKPHHVGVLITGFLACSGLIGYTNLQPSFNCLISPNLGFNEFVQCGLQYNCTTPPCTVDKYYCSTNDYTTVKSKEFHEYIDSYQPFKMYCPIGVGGEFEFVAEGFGSCDEDRKCEIDLLPIIKNNQTLD